MGFSFRRQLLATLSRREAGVTQQEWKRLKFTYAQEGEDVIARALLPEEKGTYVEVGAFHPVSISNTYLFYRMGWRGVVVEPVPEVVTLFRRRRPGDVVLECAVSDEEGVRNFEIMRAGETNRLAGAGAASGEGGTLLRTLEVRCRTLKSILSEHFQEGRTIDFMTIDTEGHDLNVLRSNDWARYRPRLLAVEDFEKVQDSPVCQFLSGVGYRTVITSRHTRFFMPDA